MAENSVFVSYRRDTGYPWARLVWDGLRERSVDAFLDLESMRAAGRFDQRLLNQIGSRPYFLMVLTQGTLDRCADPEDWVRREIEHAIEANRIIVPLFVAPFEPSGFPPGVPAPIVDALCQSNGLTVYSQYLEAAIDKLATELLTPVSLPTVGLSEDDERFQSHAAQQVESLPSPEIPETPSPGFGRGDSGTSTAEVMPPHPTVAPAESDLEAPTRREDGPDAAPFSAPAPGPGASPPDQSDAQPSLRPDVSAELAALASTTDDTVQRSDSRAETPPVGQPTPTPASGTDVTGGTASGPTEPPPSAAPGRDRTVGERSRDEPSTPHSRRRGRGARLAAGAIIAVLLGGAIAAFFVLRSTEPGSVLEADVWLSPGDVVRSEDGAHELAMTEAGQLQLRSGGEVIWSPSYPPVPSAAAILQASDGNFVVYRSESAQVPLWASNTTAVGPGAVLRVLDDAGRGFVVIEDADGAERWRRPQTRSVDPSGSPATTAAPPATTAVPSGAEDTLQDLVVQDAARVDQVIDNWFAQLSAKHVGAEIEGEVWDADRILAEHEMFRIEYDAVLVDGSDYNIGLDDEAWFVTLVPEPFPSADDGLQWCTDEGFGRDDCFVRFLSADPDVPPSSRRNP